MKKILITLIALAFSVNIAAAASWSKRSFNVYIETNPKLYIMKKAFGRWQSATNKFVKFDFTNNVQNADITCDFTEKLEGMAVGVTQNTYLGDKIIHSKISLANKTLYNRILTDDEYYRIMLHEIGHALGLPHSTKLNSIMRETTNEITNINFEDIKDLKQLYQQ